MMSLFCCVLFPLGFVLMVVMTHSGQKVRKVRRKPEPAAPPRVKSFPGKLLGKDPRFSGALFLDHAQLVYTRAFALISAGTESTVLATILSPAAVGALKESLGDVRQEGLVLVGGVEPAVVPANLTTPGLESVEVTFLSNITLDDGSMMDREEKWLFSRPAGSLSPEPAHLRVLCCTQCGSTEDPGLSGVCPSCDSPRTEGGNHWRVTNIQVVYNEVAPEPAFTLGGGEEAGFETSTVRHPNLKDHVSAWKKNNPGESLDDELERVGKMFVQLQEAWTLGEWEAARPLMSDALFTANQGWLEHSRKMGHRNYITNIRLRKLAGSPAGAVLCGIERDAWVEVLTVRFMVDCYDWTERLSDKEIIGGSKTEQRHFSEYWTFVRSIGARRKTDNIATCPSCGASLRQMQMSGVCGYCNSKVSSGEYDWVATRIAQDEDVAFLS